MLIIEALVIGVSAALTGLLFAWILTLARVKVGDLRTITLLFFFTGVFLHVFYEAVGANAWYCKKGVACARKA